MKLLQIAKVAIAIRCYGNLYPAYIKESGINTGDAEWLSVTTNTAQTNLFLGGYSKAVGLFPNVAAGQYPFAANYKTLTGHYVWSKIYFDITGNNKFDAVNLKPDDTVLALAGSTADKMTLFVFLVDPNTGAQLYPYFTVSLDYPATLLNDQSMVFTAGSRLYLTPEFDRGAANSDGNWSSDGMQVIVVQYATNGVTKLWHRYSIGGQDGGSSANLINVLPTAADGSERVLMGGGVSIGANNAFVLALYLISPVDGSISQINLQYGAGGTLFTDQTVYHYFSRTKIQANYLYAITRSAKQDARGSSTYYCQFTFTDTTFSALDTSVSNNQRCISQNAGNGYSPSQIVFDFVPLVAQVGTLHVVAYDSQNQQLLYLKYPIQKDPVTQSTEFTTLAMATGQPYHAGTMAHIAAGYYVITPLSGIIVQVRQAFAIGGTSSFTSYASPVTNSEKMPYINSIQTPVFTCSTQSPYTELYVASNAYIVLFSQIAVVAQSTTFQNTQTFLSNTVPLSTANFKTQNLNFNSISTCDVCRSYSTVTTTAGSFPNQILYQSYLNQPISCVFTPNKATSINSCTTPNAWQYTIDESSLNLSFDVFAINPVTNTVQLVLRDSTLAEGDYLITVVGTLPNLQTQSFQFYLSIVPGTTTSTCQTGTVCATSFEATLAVIGVALTNQAYTTSDATLLYVTPAYSVTSAYCVANDIVYSMIVTPMSTGQSTSFITFDSTTRTVSIYSASNTDAGTFTVQIVGSVTNLHQTIAASQNFTLVFSPKCSLSSDSITISSDPSFATGQILSYTIASASASLQLPPFVVGAKYCTNLDVVYTMTVTPVTVSQSFAFISYNTATRTVSVYSTTNTDTGTFNVDINGAVTNQLGTVTSLTSYTFTVLTLVSSSCQQSSDSISIAPDPSFISGYQMQYLIGSDLASINIPPYILTAFYCSQSDITYTQSITTMPSGLPTSQFTFMPETITTSWFTANINLAGDYFVTTVAQVTNSLGTQTASVVFQLTFIVFQNQPPVLLGFSQPYYDIQNAQSIQLGPIYNPNVGHTVTATYNVVPPSNSIEYNDGELTIQSSAKMGYYGVIIILKDSSTINQGVAVYTLYLNKSAEIVNATTVNATVAFNDTAAKNKTGSHHFIKMTIDRIGKCTVYFSELLVVPLNYSQFNSSQLEIQFLSPYSVEPNWLQFNWTLTEFHSAFMRIQIDFENPVYVSSSTRNKLDTLQVLLVDPLKFVSLKTITTMTNMTNISSSVPAQFASTSEKFLFDDLSQMLAKFLGIVIITTFVLNVFLRTLLQKLFGMVDGLQIVIYLVYFNVCLPANVQTFFYNILEAANFDIIPVDTLYAELFPFLEAAQNQEDQQIFEQVRVLLLAAIGLVGMIPLLLVLKFLQSKWKQFRPVYFNVYHMLFWNSTLVYVMQSYISLTYFAVSLIANGLNYDTAIQRAWSVGVLIVLVLYVVTPVVVTFYFRRKFQSFISARKLEEIELNNAESEQSIVLRYDAVKEAQRAKNRQLEIQFYNKFTDVTGLYDKRNKSSTIYITLFCYQRLIQVLLIVFVSNYGYAQVQLMSMLQLLVLVTFGYSWVFYRSYYTLNEYFDQFTIMLCTCHYFLFTDYVEDPLIRYKAGYSLIAICCVNLTVHLLQLASHTVQETIMFYKVRRYRYYVKKLVKEIKANRILEKNQKLAARKVAAIADEDLPHENQIMPEQPRNQIARQTNLLVRDPDASNSKPTKDKPKVRSKKLIVQPKNTELNQQRQPKQQPQPPNTHQQAQPPLPIYHRNKRRRKNDADEVQRRNEQFKQTTKLIGTQNQGVSVLQLTILERQLEQSRYQFDRMLSEAPSINITFSSESQESDQLNSGPSLQICLSPTSSQASLRPDPPHHIRSPAKEMDLLSYFSELEVNQEECKL